MNLKDKKLLVIGGAGLIGSHTVDALLNEEVSEIRIFDNLTRGSIENLATALKDPRVKMFDLGGDILHEDILSKAMEGIDGVFHFAALWLLHCYEFPRSAFEVNIRGTFNVFDVAIRQGVKRVVFSSSASVYGDALHEPITEDHPYNNNTFYGASKIAGEHMARSLYHRYKGSEQEFNYVALRYMNVYGPRQDYRGAYIAVIMKMLDRVDRGLPLTVHGDGSQAYDFIYVEDCAAANICAMKSDATDEFYNVCRGKKTSINELSKLVLEVTGSDVGVEYFPSEVSFVKNRVGCPLKAKQELGFEAKMELREGIQKLIDWRRNHKEEVERRRKDVGLQ